MRIQSNSFRHEEMIPSKYTCEGINISPNLFWSKEPEKTVTFAVVCDDPDAPSGDYVHWVLYNIPKSVHELPEHFIRSNELVQKGFRWGLNDYKQYDYKGPCPPTGTHRYFFKLFALDCEITREGLTKKELWKVMEGHVLDKAVVVGKYIKEKNRKK